MPPTSRRVWTLTADFQVVCADRSAAE